MDDQESSGAACLMCNLPVDPLDPLRGTVNLQAWGSPRIPVHLPCVAGWGATNILALYRKRIGEPLVPQS